MASGHYHLAAFFDNEFAVVYAVAHAAAVQAAFLYNDLSVVDAPVRAHLPLAFNVYCAVVLDHLRRRRQCRRMRRRAGRCSFLW